ncbi:MAG: DUF262 domain-containing protein [Treponema sp.]|jgi:hypothetical protein|nr:DUF262 domain-containing protein [Treponema sp.]
MDVTSGKQNIDQVFAGTTCHIDFYQRQYKWGGEPVKRLPDDIFYKFNMEFKRYKKNETALEKLAAEKYSWYYLNAYVINDVNGKVFVVDWQQRLTTLTLILIKMLHQADKYHSDLRDWIAGTSGYKKEFWMNHEHHKQAMKNLLDDDSNPDGIDTSTGITAKNLIEKGCSKTSVFGTASLNLAGKPGFRPVFPRTCPKLTGFWNKPENYKTISEYLERELTEQHKFEIFVFYFLKRLVLINLNIEQTDVPMIFEVMKNPAIIGVEIEPPQGAGYSTPLRINDSLKLLHNPSGVKAFLKNSTTRICTKEFTGTAVSRIMNMRHSFSDLVLKTGNINGFHIEHILAENSENYALFDNDREKFERERGRLGGLLLLKGNDNISSGNEPYSEKLKSYANTLYWNETLREDSYKSKLDFTSMKKNYNLNFRAFDNFGPDELEERHQLLYSISKYIWR